MTDIAFHFNVPDTLAYTSRLLRKIVGTGAQVVVTAQPPFLQALDTALWALGPSEFVAHCLEGSPAAVWQRSPAVLSTSADASPHHQVLVNVGSAVPQGFAQFKRLIEVVSANMDERDCARTRWKYYAAQGYTLTKYDQGPKG